MDNPSAQKEVDRFLNMNVTGFSYPSKFSLEYKNSDCINSSFGNNDILIPLKVLEELDKHKKRQDLVGANSRTVIRSLDALRSKGSLYEGVRLGKGKGILTVKGYNHSMTFPADLDLSVPDHQILAVALSEKEAGAKVQLIGVPTNNPTFSPLNDKLKTLAQNYGASFMGGFEAGTDKVHPKDYSTIRKILDSKVTK